MKVGIVGCGVNGAFLAWKLSARHDVTVFEKKNIIGKDVCSGLVSERIWQHIPKSKELVLNTIENVVLHFPEKDVTLDFNPGMLVLNRKPLDRYVASLAQKAGARIVLGAEVKRIFMLGGKRPQVSAGGEVHEFDYLIGCDGFFSNVRKSAGIREPKTRLGIYSYIGKRDASHSVGIVPTDNGFCWTIPRKRNTEVGVLENHGVARRVFDYYCRSKRIKPRKIYSYVVPAGLTDAHRGRIALCGDAVGLTKPWSGGGILWGMVAADILAKDFPNLGKYEYDLGKYFGPKIFFSNVAQKAGKYLARKLPRLAPSSVQFDGDWVF